MIKYTESVEMFMLFIAKWYTDGQKCTSKIDKGRLSAIKDTMNFLEKSDIIRFKTTDDVYIKSEKDFFVTIINWLLKVNRCTYLYSLKPKDHWDIGYALGNSMVLMFADRFAELDGSYEYRVVVDNGLPFDFPSRYKFTELLSSQGLTMYEVVKKY